MINIICAILLVSLPGFASTLAARTANDISVKGGVMYTAGARTDTVISGTPRKTLSLKSFSMNTSSGGSCSCYDASAPLTTIMPLINMAANSTVMESHDFQPGVVAVSAAGNSIKCTSNAAVSLILECWEQ